MQKKLPGLERLNKTANNNYIESVTGMQYVVGFLFDTNCSCVALVRKNKPTWQVGKMNGVGGGIERGETPHEAMSREFQEECVFDNNPDKRIHPQSWKLYCSLVLSSGDKIDFLYAIDDDIHFLKPRTDEEPTEVVPVKDISARSDFLWSVPWLISMAITFINGTQQNSFMIIEKWSTEEQNKCKSQKGV